MPRRPVQVRLDWVTPAQQEANLDQAVSTAKQAKAAVVFAWSAGSLAAPLPDGQDQLIENVAFAVRKAAHSRSGVPRKRCE